MGKQREGWETTKQGEKKGTQLIGGRGKVERHEKHRIGIKYKGFK